MLKGISWFLLFKLVVFFYLPSAVCFLHFLGMGVDKPECLENLVALKEFDIL